MNELPTLDLSLNDIAVSLEVSTANEARRKAERAEAAKIRNLKRKIAMQNAVSSQAIKSLDYSYIKDEEFKQSFIELCQEWEERVQLYNNIKHSSVKDKVVHAKCWARFIMNNESKFNIIKEKINYNKDHYAIWGEDPIYIVEDYQMWVCKGKIKKFSKSVFYGLDGKNNKYVGTDNPEEKRSAKKSGMNGYQIMTYYAGLFLAMGEDFDEILWNTLRFILFNVEIESYLDITDWDRNNHNVISPRRVYDVIVFLLNRNTRPKVKPLIRNRVHKTLYLEPGFEAIAREAYMREIKQREFKQLLDAIRICKCNGLEITFQNVLLYFGKFRKSKKLGLHLMSERSFKKLYKEFSEDEQMKVILKHNPDLAVQFKRKNQDRSKWHKLVQEGKTYKEVINVYPDVTNSSYRMYLSRLNNNTSKL